MNRTRIPLVAFLLVVAMGTLPAFAQQKPTGGGTGGGNPNTTTTTPTPAPNRTTPPTLPRRSNDLRPFFIQGTVLMEDGSKPQGRIDIQRVCAGSIHRETSTDTSGHYSFTINPAQPEMADASDVQSPSMFGGGGMDPASTMIGNMGGSPGMDLSTALQMCEIRASLNDYLSDRISLAGQTMDRMIQLGPIVLHPMGKVEGTTISVTSLRAPKAAKKLVEKARKTAAKKNFPEVAAQLQKAVQIDPQYAEAWFLLGQADELLKNEAEAKKAYEQAQAADPRYERPYLALAQLAAARGDWQALADITEKLTELDSVGYPVAFFYNAAANFNLHRDGLAEKSARRAEQLDSQHRIPKINLLLADILFQKQDYNGAVEHIRTFLKYQPDGPDAEAAKANLEKVTKLAAAATSPPPTPQPHR